jgi:hypothetical protein
MNIFRYVSLPTLLIFLSTPVATLRAKDQLQLWLTQSLKGKPAHNLTLMFDEEFRFKKGDELTYFHMDAYYLFDIKKPSQNKKARYHIGFRNRFSGSKVAPRTWRRSIDPGMVFLGKVRVRHLPISFRTICYYRFIKGHTDRGAVRIRLGMDLLRFGLVTIGCTNEVFYNHHNSNTLDRDRLSLQLKGKLFDKINWALYYLREWNRRKIDLHVIGLKISASV